MKTSLYKPRFLPIRFLVMLWNKYFGAEFKKLINNIVLKEEGKDVKIQNCVQIENVKYKDYVKLIVIPMTNKELVEIYMTQEDLDFIRTKIDNNGTNVDDRVQNEFKHL